MQFASILQGRSPVVDLLLWRTLRQLSVLNAMPPLVGTALCLSVR